MGSHEAGTLRRCVRDNKNQAFPAKAAGSAEIMMKRSSQDWKFTTISRLHEHDREQQSAQKSDVRLPALFETAHDNHWETAR